MDQIYELNNLARHKFPVAPLLEHPIDNGNV